MISRSCAECRSVFLGEGERREQLVAFRAGDEVVVPEYAELSLPSLDGDLVPEPSRGVSIHFTRTQELDKPLLQRASQIVAKLGQILMPPLAGAGAGRQVALGHNLALVEPLQDDQLGVVPVGVPLAVVQQVVLAVRRDQLQELALRRGIEWETGHRLVIQLGHDPGGPSDDRQRALDVEARLHRPWLGGSRPGSPRVDQPAPPHDRN